MNPGARGKQDRLTGTPAGVKLGELSIVPDGKARSFVLDIKGKMFHGFVVRTGEEVHGFVDRCPHMVLPLAQTLDDYLTPKGDFIACSWHGAVFQIVDGLCVGGPCQGQKLQAWPVEVQNGVLVTS